MLGDARLTLADAPDGSYDLIIVDAFTRDAIPIHLLTREAMAIYLEQAQPARHRGDAISNRHLELASVVAGIAAANGADHPRQRRRRPRRDLPVPTSSRGTVAAVARREEDFGPLAHVARLGAQQPDPGQWAWTDDYSNIVGALMRQLRE